MVLGIFKVAIRLRDQHVFMWQSVESNIFNTWALKQIFWTFFEKLEYRSFFESTKIEFCDISKKTFLQSTSGWLLLLIIYYIFIVPWSYLLKQRGVNFDWFIKKSHS